MLNLIPTISNTAVTGASLVTFALGRPTLQRRQRPARIARSPAEIDTFAEATQEAREQVQEFIFKRYAVEYGAKVQHFMPRLFSYHSQQAGLVGAFGLRPADQTLFLERYLDEPIEAVVASKLGKQVARKHIVEIGQFAGTKAGAVRAMIVGLTTHLHKEGYRWVVFTGTLALRNAFRRLGLSPFDVARADPTRLTSDELIQWGTYYQSDPRVQFGDIAEGYAELSRARRSRD
jgi:thermostable hemolysin